MLTLRRDHLTRDEAIAVAQIEDGVPRLAEAAALVDEFQTMIRTRKPDLLDAWLPKAEQGLPSSFAHGLRADRAAVVAAMEEPWSNGQAEGQINRLKTLKRQMHGRAKLDLLKARMIAAWRAKTAPRVGENPFSTPIGGPDGMPFDTVELENSPPGGQGRLMAALTGWVRRRRHESALVERRGRRTDQPPENLEAPDARPARLDLLKARMIAA